MKTFKLKPLKKKRLNLIVNDGPPQETFESMTFQWLASQALTRFYNTGNIQGLNSSTFVKEFSSKKDFLRN